MNSKIEVSQGSGTNIATSVITESSEQRHLSRVVPQKDDGTNIDFATDAKLDDVITALNNISIDVDNVNINTDGLETLQTTANTTLSSIDSKLTSPISVDATGAVSVTNFPATQNVNTGLSQPLTDTQLRASAIQVKQVTLENNFYLTGTIAIPTTLTLGTNYFAIRNTSAVKKIMICKIEIMMFYAGVNGATRSLYNISKFINCTAITGNVIQVEKAVTSNPATIADVKYLPTGITLTGATVLNPIMNLGHVNQLTANLVYDRYFTGNPIVLGQNEGLVLQAASTIVNGSTVNIGLGIVEM